MTDGDGCEADRFGLELQIEGFREGVTVAKSIECIVHLVVNADGEYVACTEEQNIGELYAEQIGEEHATARRFLRLKVTVELPDDADLVGTAPPNGGKATLRVE